MLEKEIKLLEVTREEIVKKLLNLGAKKIFDGYIHDIYYDFPEKTKKNKLEAGGKIFRVRKKGEEHIYTIKNKQKEIGKEEGVIAKDEHETKITNVESFSKVLERYGMEKIREKKKHRISYAIGEVFFEFDNYENIPELLEIEAENGEIIKKWVKKLGLEDHKQMLGGSRKLFQYYGVEYKYYT